MSIPVTCTACSATFSVKDEYAGKRAKCPKCGEPLTVPAAPHAPSAPVVARPVVAARVPPKPTEEYPDEAAKPKRRLNMDDDETEPASPKRKRGAGDDDEDDKPAAKRKRGDSDDEPVSKRGNADDDDAPKGGRRRRRDDDDDAPKKKGGALPVVLIIVGGVLLLCCGGPAGAWFFWIKPTGEKLAKDIEAEASRIKAQASQNQAQAMSTERPKEQPPVADLKAIELAQLQKADRQKYNQKWVRITGPVPRVNVETQPGKAEWGQLQVGVLPAVVLCHFDAAEWAARGVIDDEFAYSVIGLYDDSVFGVSMRHCRVVGQVVAEPATPVAFADLVNSPDKYTGKMVEVSGLVKSAIPFGNGTSVTMTDGRADKTVRFTLPNNGKDFPPKVGDRLTVKAKVSVAGEGLVDLDFRKLVSRVPGDGKPPPPPPPAALSVAEVLKDADKGFRNGNVTVRGKVKLVLQSVDETQGTVIFEETDGKFTLHAVFPPGKWRKDFVRGGEDTIDVNGTLRGPLGNPGTGLHYDIENCDLLRRVAKDGKEVPLPPLAAPPKTPGDGEAIEVTAINLLNEFLKDAKEADAKYKGKKLKVVGSTSFINPGIIKFSGKTDRVVDPKTKKAVDYECLVHATTEDGGKVFEDVKGRVTVIGMYKKFDVDDFGVKKSKVVFLEQCKQVK